MNKKVVIIGAGGHAAVLLDILQSLGIKVTALVAPEKNTSSSFENIQLWSEDYFLTKCPATDYDVINGIGSIPGSNIREKIYINYKRLGYKFLSVVSPYAVMSPYAVIEDGVQIMHKAVIQTGALIKSNTIINTGAIVEHDCIINTHCHIAPGAVICGAVVIGDNVHIGTGACIIQGIQVGKNAVLGAGGLLTSNLSENTISFPPRGVMKSRKGKAIE